MHCRRLYQVLGLIVGCISCGWLGAQEDNPKGQATQAAPDVISSTMTLTELLEKNRSEYQLPAIWAGKFSLDKPGLIAACGVRKFNDPAQALPDDLLHLGSCTKAMTAAVIGQLCSEGKLQLETTLREVFTDIEALQESSWGDVRLLDLMQHRSGAPANLTYPLFDHQHPGDVVAARRMLLESLLKRGRPKRVRFDYSNVGFIVLGHVIEHVEGQPWESVIRARLFEPLGITNYGFGAVGKPDGTAENTPALPGRSWGHTRSLSLQTLARQLLGGTESITWQPAQIDNSPCLGPAGRVHMTMQDWSKFVLPFVEADGYKKLNIKPAVWEAMLQPSPEAKEKTERYAAGWIIFDSQEFGGRAFFHNGSNTTWYCYALAVPGKRHAILVAVNAYSDSARKVCDDIARALNKQDLNP